MDFSSIGSKIIDYTLFEDTDVVIQNKRKPTQVKSIFYITITFK